MSLKERISDFSIRHFLKGKTFLPGQEPAVYKGIGVVFSAESLIHQQQAVRFSERVKEISGETSYLFGYVHRKLDNHVAFGFPHFSLSDIGVWPDFSKHRLDIFMKRKYRVLVNLDLENYPILHYVVEETPAVFKMAISPEYPALYNIIVGRDAGENIPQLIDKTLEIFEKTVGS
jgi:hypothetical protein